MEKIVTGNFEELAPEHRGWVWGHFMDPNTVMHSNVFEIKWAKHKKGETKEMIGTNQVAKTLQILIYGKFKLIFTEENREVISEKIGDFVYFEPNNSRTWEALEDSLLISIHWPSIPNDQITK